MSYSFYLSLAIELCSVIKNLIYMKKRLLECVPNFSEGVDRQILDQIAEAVRSVEGVSLLNIDPGVATNRTVFTFIGEPEAVVEAAFLGVKKAQELIDMRGHKGEHPRIGSTDVLPLVPIEGVSMEEAVEYARGLAQRVGGELGIPVYCYEKAAFSEKRQNLADCRSGEYEGLSKKMSDKEWIPDFGPQQFNESVARSGATVIGARDFLLAVNFNLNTTSVRRANAIAFDVRERGRAKREGNPITGKKVVDSNCEVVMMPGTLKGTKAIGWYIAEYGIAQVSMNIVDMNATSLHEAFEEVSKKAAARGVKVTGTEIIGLLPLRAIIEAGKYYLNLQNRSLGVSESEIVKIAVRSMGLNDIAPFDPQEKIIEYLIADRAPKLVDKTCVEFAEETAAESPAPGGGSVAAYVGSLGAALSTMVANLSSHKAGWDDKWRYFSDEAVKSHSIMTELLQLVDEDTAAFNKIMEVFAMPKQTDAEKEVRRSALETATLYATEVPLKTIKTAYKIFDLAEKMIREGNPNSVTDAGVAVCAARAAIIGAMLNVKINAVGLKDREIADRLVGEADVISVSANKRERELIELVESIINK